MGMRLVRVGLACTVASVAACSIGGGGGGGGGENPLDALGPAGLSTFINARAVAEALGCGDTFEAAEVTDSVGPPPRSAGTCGADGNPNIQVHEPERLEEMRLGAPTFGCTLLQTQGITRLEWVIGGNWLIITPGEPDVVRNREVASTLGGEVLSVDCT